LRWIARFDPDIGTLSKTQESDWQSMPAWRQSCAISSDMHKDCHMTEQEVYARLTGIFRDVFDDEDLLVLPELTAADVAEWDSLSHVRLILSVEREFQTHFPVAEIANLRNVGEFVSLIRRRV
jgi:acyl carrier protein